MLQILEDTPTRLAITFGTRLRSTTAAFDKSTGTARLERKALFLNRRPVEVPVDEIASINVVALRAYGVTNNSPLIQLKSGKRLWLSDAGTQGESVEAVRQMRAFLGLAPSQAGASDDSIVTSHPSPAYRWTIWGLGAATAVLVFAFGVSQGICRCQSDIG